MIFPVTEEGLKMHETAETYYRQASLQAVREFWGKHTAKEVEERFAGIPRDVIGRCLHKKPVAPSIEHARRILRGAA